MHPSPLPTPAAHWRVGSPHGSAGDRKSARPRKGWQSGSETGAPPSGAGDEPECSGWRWCRGRQAHSGAARDAGPGGRPRGDLFLRAGWILAPGTLALIGEESLDGTVYRLMPLEHDHVTRTADIHILRAGNGGSHALKERALKDLVPAAADDQRGDVDRAEKIPASPAGEISQIKGFQGVRRSGKPGAGKQAENLEEPIWQVQTKPIQEGLT